MVLSSGLTNTFINGGGPQGARPVLDEPSDPSGAAPDGSEVSLDPSTSEFLTPDALEAYCESRLNSIDGQVQSIIARQQLSYSESSGLQTVLQKLQEHTSGVTNDPTACAAMEQPLHDLIEQLKAHDPGCPELGKLKQLYNNLVYTGTGSTDTDANGMPYEDADNYPPAKNGPEGDGTIDSTEMQTFISGIQGCASDLNSDSELQMIQIQSLMSQRQTAIELSTNLVQSLGDQADKIAANVGH
jgi:hypothetical protein